MMRRSFLAAMFAVLTVPSSLAETASNGVLEIISGDSVHRFDIEIADEPQERSRGLMFREFLSPEAGMLFIYPNEQIASFWMKNTLIPLDMLFIANDGTILQISPNAVPHSLQPVQSEVPVRAVFEINGGQAGAMGIKVGDTVKLYR